MRNAWNQSIAQETGDQYCAETHPPCSAWRWRSYQRAPAFCYGIPVKTDCRSRSAGRSHSAESEIQSSFYNQELLPGG